jgi:hypothetical protein
MEEDRHHKLIDEKTREDNFLAVKRVPILVKRDESTQVRFILTTIHEQCYESYMSPLSESGLKNGVIKTKKIVDVFK